MLADDLDTELPEIFLFVAALVLLMVGVFRATSPTRLVLIGSVAALAITLVLVWVGPRLLPWKLIKLPRH